jgi:biotin carboxyl carrier protein
MKLDLIVNGAPEQIEILSSTPCCRFRLNEQEHVADVKTPEPGVYSVLMDGRSYDARIEENALGLVVVIDGFRFKIDVRDPRKMKRHSAAAEGKESILAPMPGKVVRVLVSAGDTVEAGQGIMVVEAMKMQNEMKASRSGRVTTVSVKEGSTVAAGDLLATIG